MTRMTRGGAALLLLLSTALPSLAQEAASGAAAPGGGGGSRAEAPSEPPLSAIDWLSESVLTVPATAAGSGRLILEDPVTDSAAVPTVTVTPLDQPSPDRVGLLPPSATGLPRDLWSGSTEADLVTLVQAERLETLPAIQSFLVTLMIAEAAPPVGAGPDGALFLARVDKLLDLGALDPALELLRAATPDTPELFRRYFDVALLTGTETAACQVMDRRPEVAPTLPARIFCLARSGDWRAAALTLNTGIALGDVDAETEALLARFLDPELFEGTDPLDSPDRVTPLVFRMREAVGEGLSTTSLPRAFAHADLRDTLGWKTRLEAAERLTRVGAIDAAVLFDLYRERRPAASGGVWDRAAAFQALDAALGTGEDILPAIEAGLAAAEAARIEVAFAETYWPGIKAAEAVPQDADLVARVGLLSSDYEAVADRPLTAAPLALAGQLARGAVDPGKLGALGYAEAQIAAAFHDTPPPAELMRMAEAGRLGEAILRAMALLTEGADGDPNAVRDALAFFRAVGLEDLARRSAIQYLLLDRGV